jgi:hypothetical protein
VLGGLFLTLVIGGVLLLGSSIAWSLWGPRRDITDPTAARAARVRCKDELSALRARFASFWARLNEGLATDSSMTGDALATRWDDFQIEWGQDLREIGARCRTAFAGAGESAPK